MPVRKIAAHGSYRKKRKTFKVPRHVVIQFLCDHRTPLDNEIARYVENKNMTDGIDQYLAAVRSHYDSKYEFPAPYRYGAEVQNYDLESVLGDIFNRPNFSQPERANGIWWTPDEDTTTTLKAWVRDNAHLGTEQDPLFVLCLFCRDEAEVQLSNKGCCYLTTATCESLGLPDDCRELTVLRWYRDHVMARTTEGRSAIARYYETAPAIVAALDARNDRDLLYRQLHREWIGPAVDAIAVGEFDRAFRIYRTMVSALRPLLAAPRG